MPFQLSSTDSGERTDSNTVAAAALLASCTNFSVESALAMFIIRCRYSNAHLLDVGKLYRSCHDGWEQDGKEIGYPRSIRSQLVSISRMNRSYLDVDNDVCVWTCNSRSRDHAQSREHDYEGLSEIHNVQVNVSDSR